jgi:hypothetical protein
MYLKDGIGGVKEQTLKRRLFRVRPEMMEGVNNVGVSLHGENGDIYVSGVFASAVNSLIWDRIGVYCK